MFLLCYVQDNVSGFSSLAANLQPFRFQSTFIVHAHPCVDMDHILECILIRLALGQWGRYVVVQAGPVLLPSAPSSNRSSKGFCHVWMYVPTGIPYSPHSFYILAPGRLSRFNPVAALFAASYAVSGYILTLCMPLAPPTSKHKAPQSPACYIWHRSFRLRSGTHPLLRASPACLRACLRIAPTSFRFPHPFNFRFCPSPHSFY